jgi:hypothetical protein
VHARSPANGTAEMLRVSDGLAQFELGLGCNVVWRHTEWIQLYNKLVERGEPQN